MGRGNQYIQLVKILYCKQSTIGKKQLPFPHMVWGLNHIPQNSEGSVLPLSHNVHGTDVSWESKHATDLLNSC